jgi:putative transposase
MESLDKIIEIIKNHATYPTTIHLDQGWHYQHNQWVKILKKKNIPKHVT